MTRAVAAALVALAFAAGLALRLARLDARPMHHDEANQAIKFGALLEHGDYRYDFHDHHGPTLYYLSLPAAWLRGQATVASLDEYTLRGVSAIAGAATILLLPLLSPAIGRTAVVASAWLLALSPAMVFYSRMYIQEALFASFTLAFVIAVGRTAAGGGFRWAALAGTAAGLAAATKETSVIVVPLALAACALAWRSLEPAARPRPFPGRTWQTPLAGSLAIAAGVAVLFYSSFFTEPAGVLEPFRGAGTYIARGVEPASHAHPWSYYLRLLAYSASGGLRWSEALVLALAVVGAASAWLRPDRTRSGRTFWGRYLALFALATGAVFSALPYKTPWNVLPFHVVLIVVAGVGFSWLLQATGRRAVRAALIAAFAVAAAQLGVQAWRASVRYSSDPRNPYVYAQTVPDAVRMSARIRDLAALDPHALSMQVSVIAAPYRAMADSVVSPRHAERRLLDDGRRSRRHAGARHRRVDGRGAGGGGGPRRPLCRGILRPAARRPAHPLRRTGPVGPVSCPRGRRAGRPMTPPVLALAVPCYNEAARLVPDAFLRFTSTHPHVHFVMVDDGSGDETGQMLESLRASAPGGVTVIRLPVNGGKAEAVRIGILAGLAQQAAFVGFLDADLATPLSAIDDFLAVLERRPAVEFVLGSRVMLLGRDIKRRATRHYLGRVFATAVSHALDLPVYDTQCGAKVLRVTPETGTLFDAPFRSPWIFDVELIARYLRLPVGPGAPARRDRLYELTVPAWHDTPGSKLRWHDFARAVIDLGYIWRTRVAARAGGQESTR